MEETRNRYVPPHLRKGGANASNIKLEDASNPTPAESQMRSNAGYNRSEGGYGRNDGGFNRNDGGFNRNEGGYGRNDGYNRSGYSMNRSGGSGMGYGGGGGYNRGSMSSGSRWNLGGGGGGYSRQPRVNNLGFHGDVRPNARIEMELFGDGKSASGINFDKYDEIPVETSGENVPDCITTFAEEDLGKALFSNLKHCGYTKPTPVQKYSIPIGVAGRDMMACAQTGSGKTGGFLFPALATMARTGAAALDNVPNNRRRVHPTALILAPTRELASQIYEEARKFCYCTGILPIVVYGGAPMQTQLKELDRGCDLLVATPGRLVDFIERGRISLSSIRFLILDEADRMLDMGFEPQIRRIVEQEDMPMERQTFMFSATFPKEIQKLAGDFLRDYIFLTVGRVGSASKDVKQKIEYVDQRDKEDQLIRFLNTVQEGLILVFVETKRGADSLESLLCREGFPATSIHGDRNQYEREAALNDFRSGRTPVLVATDVAARGLDINGVTQVINYDLPSNIDDYVHRIGRTGRVGNIGNAFSMMNEKNRNIAREMVDLLIENEQECPQWLEQMCCAPSGGYGRAGRGGGRRGGGSRFAARDYRHDNRDSRDGGNPRGRYNGGNTGRYEGNVSRDYHDDNSAW